MATPVVVDSDVLIDYFAGVSPSADAVQRLLGSDRIALTTITLFELSCGAQTRKVQKDVAMLVQAAAILLQLTVDAAGRAAEQYRRLRRKGVSLPTPDLLIAGCCMAAGLPLLTRNRQHFERISALKLVEFDELVSPG